jgi:hypothetical protein
MRRGYARGRAKDDAVRASLRPLAPDERPLAVTLCALLAAGIGAANLALIASGWQLRGMEQPPLAQALAPAALMLVLAAGLWRRRYWALLAFQVVLTITILFAFLFLLRASNLEAVALCLGIITVSGSLFWFLVKAMARAQMPGGPTRG